MFMLEEAIRSRLPLGIRRILFGPLGRFYPKLDWAPRIFRGKTTFQALARDLADAYLHGVSFTARDIRHPLYTTNFREALQGYDARAVFDRHIQGRHFHDTLSQIQYLDMKTYLPGDILTKVDRASMAHSLEVRVPFLDHQLVEWVAQIPPSLKLRRGVGKYALKKSLEGVLPNEVLYRSKMGFAVPLPRWFRGPLADRVRQISTSPILRDAGIFDSQRLATLIERHVSGQRDYSATIWCLLMLEGFLRIRPHSGRMS
jgi:asparagine synthase (glutamine-hydrolysing)